MSKAPQENFKSPLHIFQHPLASKKKYLPHYPGRNLPSPFSTVPCLATLSRLHTHYGPTNWWFGSLYLIVSEDLLKMELF